MSVGWAEPRRPGQRERVGPEAVKPVILSSPLSGMCGEWREIWSLQCCNFNPESLRGGGKVKPSCDTAGGKAPITQLALTPIRPISRLNYRLSGVLFCCSASRFFFTQLFVRLRL